MKILSFPIKSKKARIKELKKDELDCVKILYEIRKELNQLQNEKGGKKWKG